MDLILYTIQSGVGGGGGVERKLQAPRWQNEKKSWLNMYLHFLFLQFLLLIFINKVIQ